MAAATATMLNNRSNNNNNTGINLDLKNSIKGLSAVNGVKSVFTVPSPRRARCISCSEGADLSLEPEIAARNAVNNVLPDVIVTRRSRTDSMCDRIEDDTMVGTVKYFCRSRGHGFVNPLEVRSYLIHLPYYSSIAGPNSFNSNPEKVMLFLSPSKLRGDNFFEAQS